MLTLLYDHTSARDLAAGKDAVPLFSYEEDAAGKGTLTAIPALADLLSAHFTTAKHPLAPASLAALDRKLSPYLSALGYAPDRGNRDVYRVFRAEPTDFSLKSPKLSTILIKSVDNYQNLTTIDLPRTLDAGCVAYGYIACGRILSLAVTHAAPAGSAVELTLETACAHRGRGYGKAALAALTGALTARGLSVIYRTRENNVPSARAALACGFHEAGLYYRYLGRRV